MKTIKIGRNSSNDIVLDDMTVSSSHAIIEIQDDGHTFIKDLNSKNGTFINKKAVTVRTSIYANDIIRVGNSKVDWISQVNKPSFQKKTITPEIQLDSNEITRKVTIGRSSENSIVFTQKDISSSHAFLAKKKNGEIVLVDNTSSNGTYVNGQRISMHTLHKGDKVLLANKYHLNWESIFETEKTSRWKATCVAVTVIVIGLIGSWYFMSKKPWAPEEIYSTYSKTEVLIFSSFYYKVDVGPHDFGMWITDGTECKKINTPSDAMFGTGTGFFISNDGKIMTNKHVINYWEYKPQYAEAIKGYIQSYIKSLIAKGLISPIEYLPLVNEVRVEPQLVLLGILPNDTHLSSISDLIPSSMVKVSSDNEIDLAIIQTNSKSLPAGVNTIVNLEESDVADIKVGRKIFSIGFPEGLNMASTNVGIEANNQSGEISQIRGDVEFGHNVSIRQGASGSPVFNEYGKLIGVMNAGFVHTQGYNMAIKAKYAVELAK